MAKVYQNLSWAVAYNAIAVPIAAGVLLPKFDIAMTPSLSGIKWYNMLSVIRLSKLRSQCHRFWSQIGHCFDLQDYGSKMTYKLRSQSCFEKMISKG